MIGIEKSDITLLMRIEEHCNRILDAKKRFGESFEAFNKDADYKDVIYMNIIQIGEASNQVSSALKAKANNIQWDKIYGMRNSLTHAYVKIDDQTVWDTIEEDIPFLLKQVKELI